MERKKMKKQSSNFEKRVKKDVQALFAEFEETTFASPVNYHPSGEIYRDNTGEEKLAEPDIWLRIVPKSNFSKLKNFEPK